MTIASSEINHNSVTDEYPITTEPIEVAGADDEARLSRLLQQLGMATVDHLSKATLTERSPNQQLKEDMQALLVGQDEAIESVITALNRAPFREDGKPICSLLFLGPTGVGKTELSRILNTLLHDGDERCYTRIDCSGYQSKSQLTDLIGASPSFIGYEQEAKLSQNKIAGEKHILVFDEIEKGPALYTILLQILEEGELAIQNCDTPTKFDNCIIILTSNLGAQELSKALNHKGVGFAHQGSAQAAPTAGRLKTIVGDEVKRTVPAELLNRVDQNVLFHSLDDEQLGGVVQRFNDKLNKRLRPKGYQLTLTSDLITALVESDPERKHYGGRRVTKTFNNTILARLGEYISSGNNIPIGSDIYAVLDTENAAGKAKPGKFEFEFFFSQNEELLEEYAAAHPEFNRKSMELVVVTDPEAPDAGTDPKGASLEPTDPESLAVEGTLADLSLLFGLTLLNGLLPNPKPQHK